MNEKHVHLYWIQSLLIDAYKSFSSSAMVNRKISAAVHSQITQNIDLIFGQIPDIFSNSKLFSLALSVINDKFPKELESIRSVTKFISDSFPITRFSIQNYEKKKTSEIDKLGALILEYYIRTKFNPGWRKTPKDCFTIIDIEKAFLSWIKRVTETQLLPDRITLTELVGSGQFCVAFFAKFKPNLIKLNKCCFGTKITAIEKINNWNESIVGLNVLKVRKPSAIEIEDKLSMLCFLCDFYTAVTSQFEGFVSDVPEPIESVEEILSSRDEIRRKEIEKNVNNDKFKNGNYLIKTHVNDGEKKVKGGEKQQKTTVSNVGNKTDDKNKAKQKDIKIKLDLITNQQNDVFFSKYEEEEEEISEEENKREAENQNSEFKFKFLKIGRKTSKDKSETKNKETKECLRIRKETEDEVETKNKGYKNIRTESGDKKDPLMREMKNYNSETLDKSLKSFSSSIDPEQEIKTDEKTLKRKKLVIDKLPGLDRTEKIEEATDPIDVEYFKVKNKDKSKSKIKTNESKGITLDEFITERRKQRSNAPKLQTKEIFDIKEDTKPENKKISNKKKMDFTSSVVIAPKKEQKTIQIPKQQQKTKRISLIDFDDVFENERIDDYVANILEKIKMRNQKPLPSVNNDIPVKKEVFIQRRPRIYYESSSSEDEFRDPLFDISHRFVDDEPVREEVKNVPIIKETKQIKKEKKKIPNFWEDSFEENEFIPQKTTKVPEQKTEEKKENNEQKSLEEDIIDKQKSLKNSLINEQNILEKEEDIEHKSAEKSEEISLEKKEEVSATKEPVLISASDEQSEEVREEKLHITIHNSREDSSSSELQIHVENNESDDSKLFEFSSDDNNDTLNLSLSLPMTNTEEIQKNQVFINQQNEWNNEEKSPSIPLISPIYPKKNIFDDIHDDEENFNEDKSCELSITYTPEAKKETIQSLHFDPYPIKLSPTGKIKKTLPEPIPIDDSIIKAKDDIVIYPSGTVNIHTDFESTEEEQQLKETNEASESTTHDKKEIGTKSSPIICREIKDLPLNNKEHKNSAEGKRELSVVIRKTKSSPVIIQETKASLSISMEEEIENEPLPNEDFSATDKDLESFSSDKRNRIEDIPSDLPSLSLFDLAIPNAEEEEKADFSKMVSRFKFSFSDGIDVKSISDDDFDEDILLEDNKYKTLNPPLLKKALSPLRASEEPKQRVRVSFLPEFWNPKSRKEWIKELKEKKREQNTQHKKESIKSEERKSHHHHHHNSNEIELAKESKQEQKTNQRQKSEAQKTKDKRQKEAEATKKSKQEQKQKLGTQSPKDKHQKEGHATNEIKQEQKQKLGTQSPKDKHQKEDRATNEIKQEQKQKLGTQSPKDKHQKEDRATNEIKREHKMNTNAKPVKEKSKRENKIAAKKKN